MANTITKLFVAGLLMVLPVSAGDPKRGAEKPAADLLVYVDGSNLVTPSVLLRAEAAATRMFAGIGLQVQWTERRPGPGVEVASAACAQKRPREVMVLMTSGKTASASQEAFACSLPYTRTGVAVTVFYGELHEATRSQSRLEPVVLAHVLVHEITHVLQGVSRHSDTGVMRAHWNATDYAEMDRGPLEFARYDAELIHLGLARTPSPACVEAASANSVRK